MSKEKFPVDINLGKKIKIKGRHGDYVVEIYGYVRGKDGKLDKNRLTLKDKTFHSNLVSVVKKIKNHATQKRIKSLEDLESFVILQNKLIRRFRTRIYEEVETSKGTVLSPKKGKK